MVGELSNHQSLQENNRSTTDSRLTKESCYDWKRLTAKNEVEDSEAGHAF